MYTHHTLISIFKRLSRFDFEIYKVGHQERIVVDQDVDSH
jgi:hypothetical protein